ncbi:hypothetical protein SCLCIDRAFT_27698 [Scleroderma citrinum Foug A]|uniref:Uncharacterized protein n=1 Tax=Scleroderma citrinum Foug A TaxID=1036808 RepID=A0A0C2ZAD0_9AGAM|nr:hypothetical protein SCLCIDRAFT_27698 [Scleroderma citrinum Foug A]
MESIDGASDLKKSKQNLKKGKAKAKEPTEHTTPAAPTDNPHNGESSEDDKGVGQGAGEREWSMVGKGKARNEANEAVASMKRKMPVKGNSNSDSFKTPKRQVTCVSCMFIWLTITLILLLWT